MCFLPPLILAHDDIMWPRDVADDHLCDMNNRKSTSMNSRTTLDLK